MWATGYFCRTAGTVIKEEKEKKLLLLLQMINN